VTQEDKKEQIEKKIAYKILYSMSRMVVVANSEREVAKTRAQ
jgi:hypothetical protein